MLFTAYLLVLMVMPCNEHEAESNAKQELTQGNDNHSHKDDELDLCTPFCICNSCVAAIILQSQFEINFFIPATPGSKTSNFYKSVNSQFHGSIWQPPKLV